MAVRSLSLTGKSMALNTVIENILPGTKAVSPAERDLLIEHMQSAKETIDWLDNNQAEIREALVAFRAGKAGANI